MDSISNNITNNSLLKVKNLLFVLWFKWEPEKTEEVNKLWREFKFPKDVKVIGRYLLIGRHIFGNIRCSERRSDPENNLSFQKHGNSSCKSCAAIGRIIEDDGEDVIQEVISMANADIRMAIDAANSYVE